MRSDTNPFTKEPHRLFDKAVMERKKAGAVTDDYGNEVLPAVAGLMWSNAHEVYQESANSLARQGRPHQGPKHFVCRRCGLQWVGQQQTGCIPHLETRSSGFGADGNFPLHRMHAELEGLFLLRVSPHKAAGALPAPKER